VRHLSSIPRGHLVVLEETREVGSVSPLRDRRGDIYEVAPKEAVEIVTVK
jgi:hypothetical protein